MSKTKVGGSNVRVKVSLGVSNPASNPLPHVRVRLQIEVFVLLNASKSFAAQPLFVCISCTLNVPLFLGNSTQIGKRLHFRFGVKVKTGILESGNGLGSGSEVDREWGKSGGNKILWK